MLCRRCACTEFQHTRYGNERVCDICGPHGCTGFVPELQTCHHCGESDSTHEGPDDCLKALRERIEALEAAHGKPSP